MMKKVLLVTGTLLLALIVFAGMFLLYGIYSWQSLFAIETRNIPLDEERIRISLGGICTTLNGICGRIC